MRSRIGPTPPIDSMMIRRFPEAERKPLSFTLQENDLAGLDERGDPIEWDDRNGEREWSEIIDISDYGLD